MKRYFVECLLVVVLLCGCTSPMTNHTVSTDSSTKTSATNFVEQYKNIESLGIFEAMENDGDLHAGRFRYVRDINKKDFIQALSESKPIDRSETNINNSKLSFMVFADGSVFSYKYLAGESLIYDKKANKYYLLPSKLSNIINQTLEDKNMSNLYTLLYKGIPYSGIALAETINPKELLAIGQVYKTTYYIKKNSSQPVNQIYYLVGNNGSSKDKFTYSAFQIIQTVKR